MSQRGCTPWGRQRSWCLLTLRRRALESLLGISSLPQECLESRWGDCGGYEHYRYIGARECILEAGFFGGMHDFLIGWKRVSME